MRKNLGEYEVKDQLSAARIWASKRYVDARRIGIWGWVCAVLLYKRGVLIVDLHRVQSYGGFMSSKVIEANAGVHSLAMAVAVRVLITLSIKLQTKQLRTARYKLEALWSVYFSGLLLAGDEGSSVSHPISSDSIYTERYMDTPQNNPDGYVNASISDVEGFKNVDFLLAHGSGDDNGKCCRTRICWLRVLMRRRVPAVDSAFCQLGAFAGYVHSSADTPLPIPDVHGQVRNSGSTCVRDLADLGVCRRLVYSDHSISKRGAYRELYEWMTSFLVEHWGTGGYRRGW